MDPVYMTLIAAWGIIIVWVAIIIALNGKQHPKTLFVLFFVELWERFSYYGMRAFLVLYITAPESSGGFGLAEKLGKEKGFQHVPDTPGVSDGLKLHRHRCTSNRMQPEGPGEPGLGGGRTRRRQPSRTGSDSTPAQARPNVPSSARRPKTQRFTARPKPRQAIRVTSIRWM